MLDNVLDKEFSLYLQEHKDNPVSWQPFSKEITDLAKKNNKPVLFSIGYSSCHWCHVMAHDSFEDSNTADFVNENFIPVKIDREEYPDIDKKYQMFLQITRQMGGWPLTVFTDPDLTPFYGGTFFPKEEMQGIPSFMNVLKTVSELYQKNDEKLDHIRNSYFKFISRFKTIDSDFSHLEEYINNDKALENFESMFDNENGGLKGKSKFPNIPVMNYLSTSFDKENIRDFLILTADKLCTSSVFDHINGGFFRYCVDEKWSTPHFEKMLYDNALNADFLVSMFDKTGNKLYYHVARKTLDFIIETFSTDYGFASSMNADTPDENDMLKEGHYYKFDFNNLPKDISDSEKDLINSYFSFNDNILSLKNPGYEDYIKLEKVFEKIRVNIKKDAPVVDNKVIISWNMLFIKALLNFSEITGEEYYMQMALNTFNKVKNFLTEENGEVYRIKYTEEFAFNHRTLEDYAYSLDTVLKVFEITKDKQTLDLALNQYEKMMDRFFNGEIMFFDTEHSVTDTFDEAVPSAFGKAYTSVIFLSEITDIEDTIIENLKNFAADRIMKFPTGHPTLLRSMLVSEK